ncbi:MAG: hypothetical protein ABID40_04250 [Candidatus Bipolaricaulota bacterium]
MAIMLLEQAFAEAAKLPEDDQRALAEWILEELQSERRWQEAFAASQGELGHLAEEAQAEFRTGKTQSLDIAKP